MTNKRINQKPFYYNHVIDSFIVDTMHLDIPHKYAYLTLIWEAHKQRGNLTQKSLEAIYVRNKDIPLSTYTNILNEFWDKEDDSYTNSRVTVDLQQTKQHRDSSSKGGNSNSLQKMVSSDKRIDEFRQLNKMMPPKHNKRLSEAEGLELYCKQLLANPDKFTFNRLKEIILSFKDNDPQYYPALGVIFRDTQGRFWKLEQELTSDQKMDRSKAIDQFLQEKGYTWETNEERWKIISDNNLKSEVADVCLHNSDSTLKSTNSTYANIK